MAIALKKYLKTDIKMFRFKCLTLLDFLTFLETFGIWLYILENAKKSKNENSDYQIFHKSCSSCMFSTKKNLRWYFIFSLKNVLQNTKMSKKGGFHPFLSVFGGPETIWGKIEKPKKINSYSTSCIFFIQKKLRWYYFIFNPKNLLEN